MKSKLILIEGLPGSGKTTTAQLVHDILTEMNMTSQLFVEGNPEHPADYEGVASFKKHEFDELVRNNEKYRDLLCDRVIKQDNHYFLEYGKIINESGSMFPDELLWEVAKHDVYELPLHQNREMIIIKWKRFAERALNSSDTFVFECCFIQNPVTVGMIKYGANKGDVIGYVTELETIVKQLNPLLIYVEQGDLAHSFKKAVQERTEDWSKGFIEYYTNQGYGKKHGYKGLEGTLQVLKARKHVEDEIFNGLTIAKKKVDNSSFHLAEYKQVLAGCLLDSVFR
ncbi:hypothetical protein [Paenibacillus sp. 481]|uniref:hypothetical protein n=1 Tax=Paenibacillus sp. 481 TaxID=2835869 RepID=UPI001E42C604|nr:hypothetical protein [Paenibacillus sp. 481]UHA75891.1 hypothetical protein KIK04_06375 [Paenibacillus sp. 481]